METKLAEKISVRAALAMGSVGLLAFGLGVFFLGIYVARADSSMIMSGVVGGVTRRALSFAGVLKGVAEGETATVTFKFHNGERMCTSPGLTVSPGEGGAFSVEVPLGTECGG